MSERLYNNLRQRVVMGVAAASLALAGCGGDTDTIDDTRPTSTAVAPGIACPDDRRFDLAHQPEVSDIDQLEVAERAGVEAVCSVLDSIATLGQQAMKVNVRYDKDLVLSQAAQDAPVYVYGVGSTNNETSAAKVAFVEIDPVFGRLFARIAHGGSNGIANNVTVSMKLLSNNTVRQAVDPGGKMKRQLSADDFVSAVTPGNVELDSITYSSAVSGQSGIISNGLRGDVLLTTEKFGRTQVTAGGLSESLSRLDGALRPLQAN